jgi:hypothetical protein
MGNYTVLGSTAKSANNNKADKYNPNEKSEMQVYIGNIQHTTFRSAGGDGQRGNFCFCHMLHNYSQTQVKLQVKI